MKSLIRINIIHSVLLENLPQLFFQTLYASEGQITETVLLASTASLLSVIASCLTYFIDHRDDTNAMEAAQYYLAMERKLDVAAKSNGGSFGTLPSAFSLKPQKTLTKDEMDKIELFKGHRLCLSMNLCKMWGAPEKSIEIGETRIIGNVSITHIVQLMTRAEIDKRALDLCSDRDDNEVNAMFIVKRFYAVKANQDKLHRTFREHFHLDEGFQVELQVEKGTMAMSSQHSVFSTGSSSITTAQKSTSFRTSTAPSTEDRVQSALKDFFENGGGRTDVIRMVDMMQKDSVALPGIIEEEAPGMGNGGTANVYHDPMDSLPMEEINAIAMELVYAETE